MRISLLALIWLGPFVLLAQINRSDTFDTSGMPRRPANFVEQQILDLIASHTPGDLADAARIQRKLGRYYADKGDETRAASAFRLAAAAEEPTESHAGEPPAKQGGARAPVKPPPASRFSGNYFGYDGRALHTWEFRADGTFLHTWMVSGAGTSVRNSERGAFDLSGDTLALKVASGATGFTTPGAGGRSTVAGGGGGEVSQTRRLTAQFVKSENTLVLDGVKLKPKSW